MKTGNQFYHVYFKYGFPFKNYGLGVSVPDLVRIKRFNLLGQVDFWSQDHYGNGIALSSTSRFEVAKGFNILAQIGYKTKGYIVGKTTKDGIFGYIGLNYDFDQFH